MIFVETVSTKRSRVQFACKFCTNCLPMRRGHCGNHGTRSQVSFQSVVASSGATSDSSDPVSPSIFPSASPPFLPAGNVRSASPKSPSYMASSAIVPSLHTHEPLPEPAFVWGEVDGASFFATVSAVYDEIVHWRGNLFSVPHGNSGKLFVKD